MDYSKEWKPQGPPSTWRLQFQEHDYTEYMNNKIKQLKTTPAQIPVRRRTAVEILQDAYNYNLQR